MHLPIGRMTQLTTTDPAPWAAAQAFAHYSRAAAPPHDDEPADPAGPSAGEAAPWSAAEAAREAVQRAYLAPVLGGEEPTVPAAAPADAGACSYPQPYPGTCTATEG